MNAKNTAAEVAVPEEGTDLLSMSEVQAKLASFTDKPMVFSSFDADDIDSQKKLAMAVTDADPLNENLGKTFFLKDFVVQATTMIDDRPDANGVVSNEEKPILRIILVTAEGKAYSCAADGIFKVLQTYTGIFGHPSTWPAEGIPMQGVESKGRRGFRYLTLKLV